MRELTLIVVKAERWKEVLCLCYKLYSEPSWSLWCLLLYKNNQAFVLECELRINTMEVTQVNRLKVNYKVTLGSYSETVTSMQKAKFAAKIAENVAKALGNGEKASISEVLAESEETKQAA